MLPRGHRGLIVCNARRAEQWRKVFQEAGIAAIVVETDTEEAEAGASKVCVPERKLLEANAIVTEVTTGTRSLPGITVPWQVVIASLVALSMLAGLVAR